jgi:hypothetical protein
MTQYTNWRENKDWKSGSVGSRLHQPLIGALIGLAIFSGFSVALYFNLEYRLIKNWQRILSGQLPVLDESAIAAGFFLLNLLVVYSVLKTYRAWKRFGGIKVQLDPFPGAIGGEVGGSFSLPFTFDASRQVEVSINCLSVSISKSSNRSSRHESVKWRDEAKVETFAGVSKTVVQFVCSIPDHLPETSEDTGSGSIYWAIRIQVPAENYDQDFAIPVLLDAGPSRSSVRIRQIEESLDSKLSSISPATAIISEVGDTLNIEYPVGREKGMGMAFKIIALILIAVSVFMGWTFYHEITSERTSYFSAMVEFMITSGFGLTGLLLLLAGIYVGHNRLSVQMDQSGITSTREIFFWRKSRMVPLKNIEGFYRKVTSQFGQGAKSNIHYTLWLVTKDQDKVAVADGIPGQEDAEALLALFNQRMGWQEGREVDFQMKKLPMPEWAGFLLPALKIFGNLIFLAVIAAFIFDFFSF